MPAKSSLLALGLSAALLTAQTINLPDPPAGAYNIERQLEYIGAGIWVRGITWEIGRPSEERVDPSPTLEVQNPHGAIQITVENVTALEIRGRSGDRPASKNELAFAQTGKLFQVLAKPVDSGPMDLELVVPYGILVNATTTDGPIEYTGWGKADLQTDFGDIRLSFPAQATHFELVTAEPPGSFSGNARVRKSSKAWTATDRLPGSRVAWGPITLKAQRPGEIEIHDLGEIPEDSPVKMHWQAEAAMSRLFRRAGGGRSLKKRSASRAGPVRSTGADFSADVRLTQLEVSVIDADGKPIPGLGPSDFEVFEDGEPQTLSDVSNIDAPFNLAVLLDCSDSTERDRWAMEQAAQGFVSVAREGDKVAMYALASTMFQVLSPLTGDHDAARASVRQIGVFGGATPLYDAIVLSYAQELSHLPRERNALVLLTDGLENQIIRGKGVALSNNRPSSPNLVHLTDAPSTLSFDRLRKAAQEMDALIYPVILDPLAAATINDPALYEKARDWAMAVREQAHDLAEATGGRVFEAQSITHLDDVYDQVAAELRSVYTLSYRPQNQDFDGQWRRVKVTVAGGGVQARTRPGYYAD